MLHIVYTKEGEAAIGRIIAALREKYGKVIWTELKNVPQSVTIRHLDCEMEIDAMELKDILEQLSTFGNDQPVPREALAEAVRHKEEITPVLLDSLDTLYEKVQTEGEAVYDDPAYDLSAYALFLLAEMREQRAFPKLLRLLTLDSDDIDLAFGDIISYIGNILYSTYNGDLPAAEKVLSDSSLDPFAREAPLDLMEGLFRDGRLPREELTAFLRERLAALGTDENEAIVGGMLVSLIANNDLYELTEDVREAFRLEKIDVMHLGEFDSFFDYLYGEDRDIQYTRLVTDTAEELTGWDCFQDDTQSGPSISEILSWNVGRNDPCPCGSGKKFKKCCLPKKEEWEFRFNSEHSWEINRDRYPPVERQENRPGLLDFYDADAIEVDRLAYRAMLMLDHPNFQQKKESRKTHAEARKLLLEAFEKFRQICEAKGLKTSDEYDRDHKLHYYSREWLRVLCDLLADAGDERYHAVHAML